MNADFVSFEQAKKLKEKGFDKYVEGYYKESGILTVSHFSANRNILEEFFSAPTIAQALKWLREEKHLHISVDVYRDGYQATIVSTIFPEDKDYTDSWRIEGFHDTYEAAALAGIEQLDKLI